MQKRGFIGNWKNKRWQTSTFSSYAGGQTVGPGGAPGGTVDSGLVNYFTVGPYATGQDYWTDSDGDRHYYDSEKLFLTPPFLTYGGEVFRFGVLYTRSSRTTETCSFYFCIIQCEGNGTITSVGTGRTSWLFGLAPDGTRGTGLILSEGAAAAKWTDVTSRAPSIEQNAYNMMMNRAYPFYETARKLGISGTTQKQLLSMSRLSPAPWTGEPLYWTEAPTGDINDIVARARSLSNYKYWYGGAGQVATRALADKLREQYGSIWTKTYYEKALRDIGQRVGDCSYLVNYAYGAASPGNHGIGTSGYLTKYSRWSGAPKNGMIAWRNGHTGIYADGKTIELVGIDYDYQEKNYDPAKWSAILYDRNRTY